MAELSAQERAELETAFAKILSSSSGEDTSPTELTLGATADAKSLFCENWNTVKMVLEFLKGVLPGWLRPIIGIIISLGDAAHSKICTG